MFSRFLEELDRKSIRISYNSGKLTFEGPEENVTPDIIEKLRKHKANLIKYHWPAECINMMPINPLGNKIPFILVYFEVMNYPLSDFLGKDQPFYGFLHVGSHGEKIMYDNVESYAADYVRQLQKIVPNGPYFLGGFSFGGVVAFEMAVQLQKNGYDVPFLALLDSSIGVPPVPMVWHKNLYKIIRSNILGPFRRRSKDWINLQLCRMCVLLKKPIPLSLRNLYIVSKYEELTNKYKPGRYKGDILLFRSDSAHPDYKYNGWELYADNIHVVPFSGGHLTIAREKEYARIIGTEFLTHLARVTRE